MSKIEVNQISSQCGSTLTIGQSGDTVTLAAGATQSGFGQTYSSVEYCTTVKTAPFSAVAGKGYFVNTTCGAVTVTLPASPTAGDVISFKDYTGTFATNNLTLCRNGNKFDGSCSSAVLSTANLAATFIYADATRGWLNINSDAASYGKLYVTATGGTITTCGDYKTHVFTSSGSFCVSCAGNSVGSNTIDYIVIGGGGGAGGAEQAGGGGAGGFRLSNSYGLPAPTMSPLASGTGITLSSPGAIPVTIGGGGSGGGNSTTPPSCGTQGSSSTFSTIISVGGGGGGRGDPGTHPGLAGGSGGGSSGNGPATGGTGNTPPTTPPQGNDGGGSSQPSCGANVIGAAGGGGAGAVGTNAPPSAGGPGGIGSYVDNTFFGTASAPAYGEAGPVCGARYFAGGGGGGVYGPSAIGCGGIGGGGDGQTIQPVTIANTAGSTNMGGGGGGAGNGSTAGAAGGSGIVVIRYKYQN